MTQGAIIYRNARVFDGQTLHDSCAASFQDGILTAFGLDVDVPLGASEIDLAGDILSPGYVDLQVNGGDGIMFNDDPSVDSLRRIASAHRRLGVHALLPTLITDTLDKTRAAIAAAVDAVRQNVPGIAGLHLEGPHLSVARKGAHDAALIRSMEQEDLDALLAAASALPVLMVTVAPENVTPEQVQTLSTAGVVVSLGHTDAGFETCRHYFASGARCATHLFNAMSQLGNREPGLVGATLATGGASAGLIADAVHVHPETMRTAWQAKEGPGHIFLVSDSMAVAGTDHAYFELGGRPIQRKDGVLTLADGTLAGADLDLTTAIRVLVEQVGVSLEDALRSAISHPAQLIGRSDLRLDSGQTQQADMIRIASDLRRTSALM
ncbi:N-acetylglucosamine-6-phosphate deacetylase [Tateyamaria omphalii]|uniref:N-acetylglucosamine-6-phosphate deacetylase n=1 Tax=Tateyamaria omphalii TaxID=299262 RepID=UPI00167825E9|nr:N-acetylglucosamine-6-phosphate deacetylase [Tateyamaria omphalii]GGX67646.1 N-acetylglucosamine-6-phosphate deacetylase [Tateyamaria omphalii]